MQFSDVIGRWCARDDVPFAVVQPVALCAALAGRVAYGLTHVVHCVAVTGRMPRSSLLDSSVPRPSVLKRWCLEVAAVEHAMGPAARPPKRLSPVFKFMTYPFLVTQWLDATRHLKRMRHGVIACRKFAKLALRKRRDIELEEVMAELDVVSYEVLRWSRIRLDCTMMMISRAFFARVMSESVIEHCNFYLYADASPQWGGFEMFAATYDYYDYRADHLIRRLLPLVSLDKAFMDVAGKTLGLLWMFFLAFGPFFDRIRWLCSRVRSVTSDFGVERLIVNMSDVLPDFFAVLNPKLPPRDYVRWLFPRALQVPGWKHLWDNLLRKGLSNLKWFPAWLESLKALVGWLRQATTLALVVRRLKQSGLQAVAELVQATSLPHFAAWRWLTLHLCCQALNKFLGSFRTWFDPVHFRSSRDQQQLKKVIHALQNDLWFGRFGFVQYFSHWICTVMQWGVGCACHGPALLSGEAVKCIHKGRRLKHAFQYATSALDTALVECNQWQPGQFGEDAGGLASIQGSW